MTSPLYVPETGSKTDEQKALQYFWHSSLLTIVSADGTGIVAIDSYVMMAKLISSSFQTLTRSINTVGSIKVTFITEDNALHAKSPNNFFCFGANVHRIGVNLTECQEYHYKRNQNKLHFQKQIKT